VTLTADQEFNLEFLDLIRLAANRSTEDGFKALQIFTTSPDSKDVDAIAGMMYAEMAAGSFDVAAGYAALLQKRTDSAAYDDALRIWAASEQCRDAEPKTDASQLHAMYSQKFPANEEVGAMSALSCPLSWDEVMETIAEMHANGLPFQDSFQRVPLLPSQLVDGNKKSQIQKQQKPVHKKKERPKFTVDEKLRKARGEKKMQQAKEDGLDYFEPDWFKEPAQLIPTQLKGGTKTKPTIGARQDRIPTGQVITRQKPVVLDEKYSPFGVRLTRKEHAVPKKMEQEVRQAPVNEHVHKRASVKDLVNNYERFAKVEEQKKPAMKVAYRKR
jgi:hypothetical protein